MSRIHNVLDQVIRQNLEQLTHPLPALKSPFLEARIMMLGCLGEMATYLSLDDPIPSMREMATRFQADIHGVRLPQIEGEGISSAEAELLSPSLVVAFLKGEVADVLTRAIEMAD